MKLQAANQQEEFILALKICWTIVSMAILVILLMPFLLEPQTIGSISPVCEYKAKYNMPCPACGMTRAFIELSAGHLSEATRLNRFSPYLYVLFVLNEIVFVGMVVVMKGFFTRHLRV